MAKKSNLPIEAHDHFRKANALHECAEKNFVQFANYAFEAGQELMLAKASTPHGGWEIECKRLFNGSLSTAKFYMQFSKHWGAISNRQRSAILLLESSLDGAAKAAKKAAQPGPVPHPPQEPELSSSPPPISGVVVEPEPDPEPFPIKAVEPCGLIVEPPTNGNGKPPKQYEPSEWFKQWKQGIKPMVKFVDKMAEGLGQEKTAHHKAVQVHLQHATYAVMEWLDVDKEPVY